MKRGTTPTIVITVTGCDMGLFDRVYIAIQQNGNTIVKKMEDVRIEGNTVTLTLTQEETLSLQTGDVQIQMRARTGDGTAVASEIRTVPVDRILQEGVI